MSKLATILRRQEFFPGFIGLFTNPVYFTRKELLKNIRHFSSKITGKTLDVGCGTKPYKELFSNAKYVGLEIDTPIARANKSADFFYDGKTFPFPDDEFDSVISSEVLEHVFNPVEFLKEINRITKIDGHLLLTVPFIWGEHEQPYDFGRYSSFGIKSLLERSGFSVIEQIKTLNDIRILFQLTNCYARKKLKFRNKKLKLLAYIIVFGLLNILGSLLHKVTPKDNDLYADNVVFAKKISNI